MRIYKLLYEDFHLDLDKLESVSKIRCHIVPPDYYFQFQVNGCVYDCRPLPCPYINEQHKDLLNTWKQ